MIAFFSYAIATYLSNQSVTTHEIDEETEEEIVRTSKRNIEMLFVRGDVVILVSPPLRTA